MKLSAKSPLAPSRSCMTPVTVAPNSAPKSTNVPNFIVRLTTP